MKLHFVSGVSTVIVYIKDGNYTSHIFYLDGCYIVDVQYIKCDPVAGVNASVYPYDRLDSFCYISITMST